MTTSTVAQNGEFRPICAEFEVIPVSPLRKIVEQQTCLRANNSHEDLIMLKVVRQAAPSCNSMLLVAEGFSGIRVFT